MANNNNDDPQNGGIPIAPPPFDPSNLLQMIGSLRDSQGISSGKKRTELLPLQEITFRSIAEHASKISKDNFNIPQDLSNQMFAYLISKKLLNAATLKLFLTQAHLTSISLERYSTIQESALRLLHDCNTLEKISIKACFHANDDTIHHIVQGCPQLKEFDISDLPRLTPKVFSSLEHCTNLEYLISVRNRGLKDSIYVNIPTLQKLRVGGCKELKSVTIGQQTVNLTILDVSDSPRLETLIWEPSVSTTLETLNLFRSPSIQNDSLAKFLLSAGTALKRLNLFECGKLTSPGIHVSTQLEELVISECRQIGDSELVSIVTNCTKLNKLFLTLCIRLTDESLAQIPVHCRRLEAISLPSTASDTTLIALVQQLPGLKNIDLAENKKITNESVKQLLLNLPELGSLSLCECSSVQDDAFACLESKKMNKLFNINLAKVPITDISLQWIGGACQNLTAIDLFNNGRITDSGLIHILKNCTELKRMYLQACARITDRSLLNISEHCPFLEYLDIYSTATSSDGIKAMLKKRTLVNLRELNVGSKLLDEAKAVLEEENVGPEPIYPNLSIMSSKALFVLDLS